ncbi:SusC/RagA family TonB-linked outer membrane protein [Zhouia spongiae]|uniref:SusC/RagA family TonB-linked outer membrane protein n=1 Tax=Zhouia spongiae TaxID=2202721 RepID=A0ABY3YL57_9FLAO|nr:SusC/RagA family TonB-linked outer membrane protein [Zhouia spongiae]UNY97893.1 SusC/RagA family TonB-linked outer membrane protein [Zhouia spongiae]
MKNTFINKIRLLLIGILLISLTLLTYNAWGMSTRLNYILNSPPLEGLREKQHQVRGVVTDSNGVPIPGVHVLISGTQTGTFTDNNGTYNISAHPTDVLIFSYVGFDIIEEAIDNRIEVNITLNESVTNLGAVTVNAGYYTVKEKERTGNISRVTAKDIELQPVANPLAAMQGRMPGVFIQQNTGVPGGNFSIQIRGRNSIASGNEPLYIVNGVPLNTDLITSSLGINIINRGSPLNGIDLSGVESIEVLKDADATAIYGSRGANGVVLITTKKGSIGKTRFGLDIQTGLGSVANKLDLLNSKQYVMMREEAFANDGIEPTVANARDLLLWDADSYTDWQEKLIGGTAYLTNLQGSISGGKEHTTFRIGGGLREETTVFPGDFKYQKASGHVQLNHFSEDRRFNATFSGNYVSEVNDLLNQDLTSFIFMPPVTPIPYTKDGNLNWGPEGGSFNNPFAILEKEYKVRTENLVSNLTLSYELTERLKVKIATGYSTANIREVQITPMASINPTQLAYSKPNANFNHHFTKSWIIEPQLEFKHRSGKSEFNILLGSSFQKNDTEGQSIYATDFSNDLLLENLDAAGTTLVSSRYNNYNYQAIFGRLNYNYNSKYILNVTGRRDGSSRFGPGKRFANFGAVGAAWVFSNEGLVKQGLPFLSFGKFRGSYGITGNDQIGDYQYLDSYSSALYTYQGTSGLYPTRLFNPLYSWETNKKLEAAIDLGFIRDRIRLSAAWFQNRSSNQLVAYPLPATTGFLSIQDNLNALVENTGLELELNTLNIDNDSFRWTTAANISFTKNTLLKYPNLENSAYAQVYEIGKSLSLMRKYHALGVNPQTGIYEFEDIDGDGMIKHPNDLQSLVELDPEFYGGIENTFSYKNLQFNILFQFVKQTGYNPLFLSGTAPGAMSNKPIEVLERWQQPGDITHIPQFTQSTSTEAYTAFRNSRSYGDNRFIDASFVRLKTISLSYLLSNGLLKNSKTSLYIQGQNLLTITGYKGFDPEYTTSLKLPPLKMFTMGVQIIF